MGTQIKTRTGEVFGRLTVVELSCIRNRNAVWRCRCSCGNITEVLGYHLKNTNSCGCIRDEKLVARVTKHGDTKNGGWSNLYRTWVAVKGRCTNPNNQDWKHYGGRGIILHNEWMDFATFKREILGAIGDRPNGMTVDRVDVNLGYIPGNLRWATMAEQNENKRCRNGLGLVE
jgi:hypothetical protein